MLSLPFWIQIGRQKNPPKTKNVCKNKVFELQQVNVLLGTPWWWVPSLPGTAFAFLSHFVSWELGLATVGLGTPVIRLFGNVGCSPFVAGILLSVSNSQGNCLFLGSGCGSWRLFIIVGNIYCLSKAETWQDLQKDSFFTFLFKVVLWSDIGQTGSWYSEPHRKCVLGLLPKVKESVDRERKKNILEPVSKVYYDIPTTHSSESRT